MARGYTIRHGMLTIFEIGRPLASGSSDKNIKLWDVASGKNTATLKGHTDAGVFSVAFSPDGKRIVSGSWDNTVKVWDVSSLDKSK